MTSPFSPDQIIQKLWDTRADRDDTLVLKKDELLWLCETVKEIFIQQPVMLELKTPLVVCGDVHGQFFDLLRIFDVAGKPDEKNYLFLGDYVDRGSWSINTIALLFAYKIKYPLNFFLLRGNHESRSVNRNYGFYQEIMSNYGNERIFNVFNEVFEWLPVSALVNGRILCLHGGISPELHSLDQLESIQRPSEIPLEGLLTDLTWSDPNPGTDLWEENDRGASFLFGEAPLTNLLDKFGVDVLIRAHQAVMTGYEFPFSDYQRIVTLFSAPNYGMCNNNAAVMNIDENNTCTFHVLEPESNIECVEPTIGRPITPPRSPSGSQPSSIHL